MDNLAKENVWEGCILQKPYKLCDLRPAYGEMFQDYLKDYDFWGHCDMDLVFGDIRNFITEEILIKYDRVGINGPFTLYRNTKEVNSCYWQIGDIKEIFTKQTPFGYDEWGGQKGTTPYWLSHWPDKIYSEIHFDNLQPYHYSFVSSKVLQSKSGMKNVMYSYDKGKLYRIGTINSKVRKEETLFVHLQKRPIIINTTETDRFSIIPPGKFVDYIQDVSRLYLLLKIRDGAFWAYYTRLRNKINRLLGKAEWQNTVLLPNQDLW